MAEKTCSRCSVLKPLAQFHKCSAKADGRQAWCKECISETAKAHKARLYEQRKLRTEGDLISLQSRLYPDGLKKCYACKDHLPLTAYSAKRGKKDGLADLCRSCAVVKQGDLTARGRHRRHGLLPEEKARLIAAVGNKCEACGNAFTEISKAFVDHDHACCPGPQGCDKCRRGFLCSPCNITLGHSREDAGRLLTLIEYLAEREIRI